MSLTANSGVALTPEVATLGMLCLPFEKESGWFLSLYSFLRSQQGSDHSTTSRRFWFNRRIFQESPIASRYSTPLLRLSPYSVHSRLLIGCGPGPLAARRRLLGAGRVHGARERVGAQAAIQRQTAREINWRLNVAQDGTGVCLDRRKGAARVLKISRTLV